MIPQSGLAHKQYQQTEIKICLWKPPYGRFSFGWDNLQDVTNQRKLVPLRDPAHALAGIRYSLVIPLAYLFQGLQLSCLQRWVHCM
ncbi:MAG: hypothetical protein DRQ42_08050, partial [Gammaproteobacteria bacterium]